MEKDRNIITKKDKHSVNCKNIDIRDNDIYVYRERVREKEINIIIRSCCDKRPNKGVKYMSNIIYQFIFDI